MTTVAVAVNIGGNNRGNGSKRAVKWAVGNLYSQSHHFVLVYVMPTITHIPTPSGNRIPITQLDTKVVAKYMEDIREKAQAVFLQYKRLFKPPTEFEFETLLLENDNVAVALVDYARNSSVRSLVLGSESLNRFWRRIKGHKVPQNVLKSAPDTCDVFVVSKRRVKTKLASSMTSTLRVNNARQIDHQSTENNGSNKHQPPKIVVVAETVGAGAGAGAGRQTSYVHSPTSMELSTGPSHLSESSQSNSSLEGHEGSTVRDDDPNAHSTASLSSTTNTDISSIGYLSLADSHVSYEQFDLHNEVEQLRLELQTTLSLYNRACEDLVHAQKQVKILSSECVVEAEKINAATEREENLRKVAEHEKLKHLQAEKDAQAAKNLLAKESYERQIAELNALKEFKERQKIVDALISNERRIRRYTPDEIRVATDNFSAAKIIGEGGYGKVFKGTLDHTRAAIKVLEHDATDKKEEFLKEIRLLSQLCHPNIVLLLGVCSEMGCLVYEYMENGSLEQHLFRHNRRSPLPWFARFRIAFEIACGLAFLHRRKPEPVVHRDLKPGNILLGRNYVTKISDVGLAKLVSDNIPDSVTMFGNSLLAGTLYYIDPEYQRTGTVRPKSDLYSFGIILLQLLTARSPNGLLLVMENAIASGTLPYILDDSVKDWPLVEVEELTKLALECCKLRCRDRPDLETVVLPTLKKLADVANASMKVEQNSIFAPSHYFCPILHEVMDDPHIAGDGFTYERRAIEAWLERHDISPVTKQKLAHFNLTPNITLLTAIQEWKSRLSSKHS